MCYVARATQTARHTQNLMIWIVVNGIVKEIIGCVIQPTPQI